MSESDGLQVVATDRVLKDSEWHSIFWVEPGKYIKDLSLLEASGDLRHKGVTALQWIEQEDALLLEVTADPTIIEGVIYIRFEMPKLRKSVELATGSKIVFFLALKDGKQLASKPFLAVVIPPLPELPQLPPLEEFLVVPTISL